MNRNNMQDAFPSLSYVHQHLLTLFHIVFIPCLANKDRVSQGSFKLDVQAYYTIQDFVVKS